MLLEIQKINVEARIRPVTDARVDALVNSIVDVGLLNPVTVVKEAVITSGQSVNGYTLVAGAHRLEAMRRLSHTEIEATVVEMDKHERRLAECDENLCGTNLGSAERAMLTAHRKECYEFLHPETAMGKASPKEGRKVCDLPPKRFTADTAEVTGKAERTIQLDAERGEKILPNVIAKITGTKIDTGTFLDEVKDLPGSLQMQFVNNRLNRKESGAKKPKSKSRKPADRATAEIGKPLRDVQLTWGRASIEDRRRIKAWVLEQETPVSDDETDHGRAAS